ncbi:MAG: ATPase, T2SS/T4P/T4SS family [bacterium]
MAKQQTSTKSANKRTSSREDDRSLARVLVERRHLTLQQAKGLLARLKNGESNNSLENILKEEEILTEDIILEAKASLWNVPFIDLRNYEIDPEVLELIPGDVAKRYRFFPLFRIDETLLIAMSDPKDVNAIDKVTQLTKLDVSPALSSSEAVIEAIEKYYGEEVEILEQNVNNDEFQDILEVIEAQEEQDVTGEQEQSVQDLERLAEEAPVVKMTNMVLMQAINQGASDIHINPEEDQVRVRYRLDGVLQDSHHLPKNLQEALISRIKILSNLDIAEHRIPQDGQMHVKMKSGKEVDMRVSTLPSAHGENVVLRILDRNATLMDLQNLGFEDDNHKKIMNLISNAYGIILVTGPTGSGKSTTLYASLNILSTIEKNIITLEDPIEYRLPLIRQSQVHRKAGMTFAKGLRAILRQDPDIVMVGEIRDQETANIAVQAALTGHLVLSTLHTNDAASAVTRLEEMGIEPFLISTAVLGVLAQRLVRRICPNCKQESEKPEDIEIPEEVIKGLGLKKDELKFFKGKGCSRCRNTGYKGRISVVEVLPVTKKIKTQILKGGSTLDVETAAEEEGMRPLVYDGWIKVMKGITTIDEVIRVTNIK